MNAAIRAKSVVAAPPADRGIFLVKRIHFAPDPPPGATIVRRFHQPRPCVASEEILDAAPSTVGADGFIVALISPEASAERVASEILIGDDGTALAVAVGGQKIQWRPGYAVVQGPAAGLNHSLEALIDFAFYEGELRRLEEALGAREDRAQEDVERAYFISYDDRKHWPRLTKLGADLCRMRLTYARLAPELTQVSRTMAAEARRIAARLLDEAAISDRLQAFSDRLEACEDLYEGAIDRIAEFRWYRGGQWLEKGIILLLLLELAVMAADAYVAHLK